MYVVVATRMEDNGGLLTEAVGPFSSDEAADHWTADVVKSEAWLGWTLHILPMRNGTPSVMATNSYPREATA